MLVDGVTKADKVTYGDAAQAETVRKMVVAMAKDIRVLVIKPPTGCTTLARGATSRSSPRSARPADHSRSTPRWPTGSA